MAYSTSSPVVVSSIICTWLLAAVNLDFEKLFLTLILSGREVKASSRQQHRHENGGKKLGKNFLRK